MKRNLKNNFSKNTERKTFKCLSLGAGVQSSTLALMAHNGDFERPDAAIFADTQREPKAVYEWLSYLRNHIDTYPIFTVSAGDLGTEAVRKRTSKNGKIYTRRLIPFFTLGHDGKIGRAQTRGCTIEFKLQPIQKLQRKLGKVHYGQDFVSVESWIGISTDEASRMRDSSYPWLRHRYPLAMELGMNRQDCLKYLDRKGYPTPPRSACYFCPFHSDDEWNHLKTTEPKTFNKAVRFEKLLQISHRRIEGFDSIPFLKKSCENLDIAKFENVGAKNIQRNLFDDECLGLCGV